MTRRRPWVSVLLSVLAPGLGHLYVGRLRAGVVVGAVLVPIAIALVLSDLLFVQSAPLNILLPLAILVAILIGVPLHAAILAHRSGAGYQLRPYNRWHYYVLFYVLVGLLCQRGLYLLSKAYVAEPFRIPSAAGEPTLLIGDYVYVAKFPRSARHPQLDALAVFASIEERGLTLVKRVVGLPGDTLSMRGGVLYRNGRRMNEPYISQSRVEVRVDSEYVAKMRVWQLPHLVRPYPTPYAPTARHWGPLVVPPDSFFALGDNRDESYDSRFYGFVPQPNIVGRPRLIHFSYDTDAGVRWERIGRMVQ